MKLLLLYSLLFVALCPVLLLGNKVAEICTTRACHETANRLMNYMDPSVDPCHDFYQFVCGNFHKTAEIPVDRGLTDAVNQVQVDLEDRLLTVLREQPEDLEPRPYRLLRWFFRLCLDTNKIFSRGVNPVLRLFKKAGGWPVLEKDWSERRWDFLLSEIKLVNLQLIGQSLFRVRPNLDLKNSSRRIIEIDQPAISPFRDVLLQGVQVAQRSFYYKFMVNATVMFGAERFKAEKQMKEVLEFQCKLTTIMRSEEQRRDYHILYHPCSLLQLQEDIPWLDWSRLLQGIMPQGVSLTREEQFIVMEPEYFRQLGVLLDACPKKTIANFMMWQASSHLLEMTSSQLAQLSGAPTGPDRTRACLNTVCSSSLSPVLASLYATKYKALIYDGSAMGILPLMAQKIREQLLTSVRQSRWMDENTRRTAYQKVADIKIQIGLPLEYLNYKNIERYYEHFRMPTDHYLKARMYLDKWQKDREWRLLRVPVSRDNWADFIKYDIQTGSYYVGSVNSIRISSSMLQLPWVSPELPASVNYGGIGSILGHELTHSLDRIGSQFDEKGNLNKWWSERSKKEFDKIKQCLMDQYSGFIDNGHSQLKVDGVRTQGENIADLGGLKLSYLAYLDQAEKPDEVLLPGLQQYNNNQLFMINAANIWCTKYRPEYLSYYVQNDVHSPAEFRVNGEMMNFPEFSRVFNCSRGSSMNPEIKCEVW